MKSLPIGVDDYRDIQDYYYVDKTLFIKELIDSHLHKSVLITRPRRFGKSLTLSMVEYFFTIEMDSSAIFKGKKIMETGPQYLAHMNAYPIVHLNMRDVNGETKEEILDKAINAISVLYRKYGFLLRDERLFEIDRDYYFSVANKKFDKLYEYQDAIKKLCYMLYVHYGKRAILLIDEYDRPIEDAFQHDAYDECMPFFKELYSNALKGNEYVLFSLVSGVLQISKESLFSGLNNLEVFSVIDRECAQYFGFTEEEVRNMLKDLGVNALFENLRTWYGGYCFGGSIELFNPWSILNYVQKSEIRRYWANSGTNSLLHRIVTDADLMSVVNSSSKVVIDNSLSYRDFADDANVIFSYLVQAGYLVARYDAAPNIYEVRVPNREIYELFKRDIIGKSIKPSLIDAASLLRTAFAEGDAKKIDEVLEGYIVSSFSYYDLRNEKDYQNIMTGILAVLFDSHVVRSENNGPLGRADIVISPKKEKDVGAVLEIKYADYPLSDTRLAASASAAINQIKRKRYFLELRQRNCSKIYLFGIAFDSLKKHKTKIEAE